DAPHASAMLDDEASVVDEGARAREARKCACLEHCSGNLRMTGEILVRRSRQRGHILPGDRAVRLHRTSVKGGDHVGPSMVRDFRGVLEREHAEMGLFICLRAPTDAVKKEAAASGLAKTVHGDIPRLQVVAIEDWFKGKLPKLPPLEHLPSAAF